MLTNEDEAMSAAIHALFGERPVEDAGLREALRRAMDELPTCTRPDCECAFCLCRAALAREPETIILTCECGREIRTPRQPVVCEDCGREVFDFSRASTPSAPPDEKVNDGE